MACFHKRYFKILIVSIYLFFGLSTILSGQNTEYRFWPDAKYLSSKFSDYRRTDQIMTSYHDQDAEFSGNNSVLLHIGLLKTGQTSMGGNRLYLILILSSGITIILLFLLILRQIYLLKTERMKRQREKKLFDLKMQFFTNISHEIRTPLSLIISPLENIITNPGIKNELKSQLQTIQRNAGTLYKLVNELLDLGKIDNNKLKLEVMQGDLISFITEISKHFNEKAAKKKINYLVHCNKETINGWFDREKLEKVIINLLSNAFKFVPENGDVKIDMKELDANELKKLISFEEPFSLASDRFLFLEVSNNGTIIDSRDIPHIFDRFYQGRNMSKTERGTGIGLALAKSLIELHHGRIMVKNDKPDETKFTIVIPLDKPVYTTDKLIETPETADHVITYEYSGIPEVSYAEKKVPESNDGAVILIAEDDDELRKYLIKELGKSFNTYGAKNGKEGIQKAFDIMPDLIVSDILMPSKTGIELCKEIKNDVRTSHIPVILLTAKATVENQIEGAENRADLYITKPFSIRYLKAQIRNLMEIRIQLFRLFSQEVYVMPGKITNNKVDEEFLSNIIDFIVKNITETELSVETLAEDFKLSRSQMYRKIKALTGKSVVEFIRTIRLKQAIKLLNTQKYSLSEIAYETGFTSPSYFTRSFKAEYGKTPSEYIK